MRKLITICLLFAVCCMCKEEKECKKIRVEDMYFQVCQRCLDYLKECEQREKEDDSWTVYYD